MAVPIQRQAEAFPKLADNDDWGCEGSGERRSLNTGAIFTENGTKKAKVRCRVCKKEFVTSRHGKDKLGYPAVTVPKHN